MLSSAEGRLRNVKIVCTLGPASRSADGIRKLAHAGMDVARLNFSHGTHDFHRETIRNIRAVAEELGKPIAILQDLQGPKLRAGALPKEGVVLTAKQRLCLHPEGSSPKNAAPGDKALPISAEIATAVSCDVVPGARILFDDGKIATRVVSVHPPEIRVEVEVGGTLTSHKGMNLPGTPLSIPCLTEKDLEDLRFGLSQGVDAVALSFVRSAADIENLRERMRDQPEPPMVVAKIEREEAIHSPEVMDAIIQSTDGLLIARGDMAVEIGAERVPTVQKKLIQRCNMLGVPVITATQMLESMIQSPTPTRAEASDVANAVFDGTDAVMLSGETASGAFPTESVETMARIVFEAERSRELSRGPRDLVPGKGSIVESIEFSASRIATHVGAVAIACLTHSGMAARTLAKFRPEKPIVAILDNAQMLRKLAFVWGVRGYLIPEIVATDDLFAMVERVLISQRIAQVDDLVVVTAGVPTLRRGTTNMVKVHRVGGSVADERRVSKT